MGGEQETRIFFAMELKDYARALWFRRRVWDKSVSRGRPLAIAVAALLLSVALLSAGYMTQKYLFVFLGLFSIAVLIILNALGASKSALNLFLQDKILAGMHTLTVSEAGIQLLNGFEKLFVPWPAFCAFRETKKYLLFLCEVGGPVVAVKKSKVNPEELDAFLTVLYRYVKGRKRNGSHF